MPGIERGSRELLEQIAADLAAVRAGGNVPRTAGVTLAHLDEFYFFSVELTDIDGTPVPAERIDPGTILVDAYRAGVNNNLRVGETALKTDGRVYMQQTFTSVANGEYGNFAWQLSDIFGIFFNGIKILDGEGNVVQQLPQTRIWGSITELPSIAADATTIKTEVLSPAHGLAALMDALETTQVGAVASSLGVAKEMLTDAEMEDGGAGWVAFGGSPAFSIGLPCRSWNGSLTATWDAVGEGFRSDFNEFREGARYYVSAWVYHTKGTPHSFTLDVRDEHNNLTYPVETVSAPSGVWTKLEGFVTCTKNAVWNGAVYLQVYSASAGTTTVCLDSASVRLLDEGDLYYLCKKIRGDIANMLDNYVNSGSFGLQAIDNAVASAHTKLDSIQNDTNDLQASLGSATFGLSVIKAETASIQADTNDLQTSLAHATYGLNALKTAITTVDTQTDILAHATNGNAAIRTAVDTKATPAQVATEVNNKLNAAVPASPTAGSLYDILSKAAGGNTFNKADDSLEAIRDRLDAIYAELKKSNRELKSRSGTNASIPTTLTQLDEITSTSLIVIHDIWVKNTGANRLEWHIAIQRTAGGTWEDAYEYNMQEAGRLQHFGAPTSAYPEPHLPFSCYGFRLKAYAYTSASPGAWTINYEELVP